MNKVSYYDGKLPKLRLEEFFSGVVKGYGLIQKNSGAVRRRFTVNMQGHWLDDKGVLDEQFLYDNGETQERQWQLTHNSDTQFTATAADIVGVAHGEQLGNALHMKYVLQIPFQGRLINVNMDDWMYRVDHNMVLNTAKMSKFGLTIGKLTAGFYKE